jgi:hypothetical protein
MDERAAGLDRTEERLVEVRRLARAVLRGLDPDARPIEAGHARNPRGEVLDTRRHDMERSRRRPGRAGPGSWRVGTCRRRKCTVSAASSGVRAGRSIRPAAQRR